MGSTMAIDRARAAGDCTASGISSMACRMACTSKKLGLVVRSTVVSSKAREEPLVLRSC